MKLCHYRNWRIYQAAMDRTKRRWRNGRNDEIEQVHFSEVQWALKLSKSKKDCGTLLIGCYNMSWKLKRIPSEWSATIVIR